jgi:ABC-2 type transport system permease protein
MRNALAIARKELALYFTSPWAYAVFTAMAGISAFFFVAMVQAFKQVQDLARQVGWQQLPQDAAAYRNLTDGVVVQLWGVVAIITLFVAPFLSMRMFAEEKRQKTFELLLTTPTRPLEIVVGKYLGGLGVIWATLGLTFLFPVILQAYGASESGAALEWPTVLLGFGGLLLWGACCMAVGMFISALTDSQALAAFLTFAVLLPWMLLRGLAQSMDEPFRGLLGYLSFDAQLQELMRGVLAVEAIVFFLSVILFFGLLTHRALDAHRWS